MVSFPNAKINIGLNILARRVDGFHNIETCFYPIGWCDVLEIIPSSKLTFTSDGIPIPGNEEDNLCLKAYRMLHEDFNIPPVHIHLHKILPIGAGLGGGSSDASFTIKMLNEMNNLNLSDQIMENYARQLGSDCAFFIKNKPVFAHEKGDVFQEISINLSGYWLVVIYPNCYVSTAEAYYGVRKREVSAHLKNLIHTPVSTWQDTIHNDFEQSINTKYPIVQYYKKLLLEKGAIYAAMSGSGSAIFGIFHQNPFIQISPTDATIWVEMIPKNNF